MLNDIGGYNESYYYSSDYDLVCNIALKGIIVNLSDILVKYTWRKDQISTKNNLKQTIFANQIRLQYLDRIGISLSDLEKRIYTKVMTNQQLLENEKYVFSVLKDKIYTANLDIRFLEQNKLKYLLSRG